MTFSVPHDPNTWSPTSIVEDMRFPPYISVGGPHLVNPLPPGEFTRFRGWPGSVPATGYTHIGSEVRVYWTDGIGFFNRITYQPAAPPITNDQGEALAKFDLPIPYP